jgi:CRP-like cAMP-binding protein
MPDEVKVQMFTQFLFRDFLKSYSKTFTSFPNMMNVNQCSYYTWYDQHYRKFMEALLYSMEPRREERGEILFDELDEVNEVFFIERGQIDIGFEINRKKQYVFRLSQDVQVGSYNVTFDKRSRYIFKASK